MKLSLMERLELGKVFPVNGDIAMMKYVALLVKLIALSPEEIVLAEEKQNPEKDINFTQDQLVFIGKCLEAHSTQRSFSYFWLGLLEKVENELKPSVIVPVTESEKKILKCEKRK